MNVEHVQMFALLTLQNPSSNGRKARSQAVAGITAAWLLILVGGVPIEPKNP